MFLFNFVVMICHTYVIQFNGFALGVVKFIIANEDRKFTSEIFLLFYTVILLRD